MRRLLTLFTAGVVALGWTGTSFADVYDLTCVVSASPTCGQPSFGKITIQDNASDASKVDVIVDLNGSGTEKVLELFLNYDDSKFSNSTNFIVTGSGTTYQIDENNIKADGYSVGSFDIQLPDTGNLGFEPVTLTIALSSIDLNPTDFRFLDSNGLLYNAVHIGNCIGGASSPGCTDGQSIFVGANTVNTGGGPDPRDVPEPATLVLFGAGLLGFSMVRRRLS